MKIRRAAALILILAVALTCTGCVKQMIGSMLGYIVKFDPNGGELVSGELKQKIKPGKDALPPVLAREGYAFDGFDGDYTNVNESLTLTARWLKLYTISFDAGDGEIEGDSVVSAAEGSIPAAPNASREDYIFEGWDREVTAAVADTTYTAQWTRRVYSAMEVSERVTPAVIEITTRDMYGRDYALGSGFFIDDKGTAVTNYHVIEGAYSAKATTEDGREHVILGVESYDKELDLAIIKINLSNTPYLKLSEEGVGTGQTVYAIGSSLGLTGTFSNGIVSTASREVMGVDCIQVTAPISQGNSGGPLVDEYCEVVGVNSMTMTEGQNLNFAINIKELSKLPEDSYISMAEFGAATLPPPGFYHVYADHEKEPNDSTDKAAELTFGADPVAGEISTENDEDCYFFVSEAGGRAYIRLKLDPEYSGLSYRFGYYKGSEFVDLMLDFSYDEANGCFKASYKLDAGKTYYLSITPMPYFSSLFEYPIYYALWIE